MSTSAISHQPSAIGHSGTTVYPERPTPGGCIEGQTSNGEHRTRRLSTFNLQLSTACSAVSHPVLLCLVGLAFVFMAGNLVEASDEHVITITADHTDYREVPVKVSLPKPSGEFTSIVLQEIPAGTRVPCQAEMHPNQVRAAWIVRALKKGQSRTYRLTFSEKPVLRSGNRINLVEKDDLVSILIGARPFTDYVFKGAPKPYCYPIIGPTGKPVTRDYPMKITPGETNDHPHQRSLWFTHGDVNGIDFWSEKPEAGKVVHRRFETLEEGPVFGRLTSVNDWIAADGKKVCEDTRDLIVYAAADGRLMDFAVTVRATEGAVKFGDTKEGTMGIRVATSMDVDKGQGHILNSRGNRDGDAWAKQAEWCDYCGPVNGQTVGIAVLDHPSSFRHPTYWHVRTYGLFAANPFGLKDFTKDKSADGSYTIPKDGEITFRYRIFIHKGDAESAGVKAAYAAYIDPPSVDVK